MTKIEVNKKVSRFVVELAIDITQVILDKTATVHYRLVYNDNSFDSKTYHMTAEEYANWSNDDNYVVGLLLTKEGLN